MTIAMLLRNTLVAAAPPRGLRRSGGTYDRSHLLLAAAAADRRSMPSAPSPRDAQRIGQWTAFRKYADDDAVMFTPQAVWAHEFLKDSKDPPKSVAGGRREATSRATAGPRSTPALAFRADGKRVRLFHHRLAAREGRLELGL